MQSWHSFLTNYKTRADCEAFLSQDLLADLSYLGLIKVAGEDAKKFLQGQLTCNLDEITLQQSKFGALCNPQGRIISFFRIFYYQEAYYLLLPQEIIPITLKTLQKYAVFSKVALSNATDTLVRIGYCGEHLSKLIHSLPMHPHEVIQKDHLIVIKMPGHLTRYLILGEFTSISNFWKNTITNTAYIDSNWWKSLDITDRIPSIYPETSEKFLPHEINLPDLGAVSFNKGCYTGQEIIARTHYRGKVKQYIRKTRVTAPNPPERNGEIYDDSGVIGNIVDYSQLSYNNYELLILIPEKVSHQNLFLDATMKIKLVE